jgi:hypothetical protein
MGVVVDQLEVEQDEIGVFQNVLQRRTRSIATGVQRGVHPRRLAALEERRDELRLEKRLTAGGGYSALGVAIIELVLLGLEEGLLLGNLPTEDLEGAGSTHLDTTAACVAELPVDRHAPVPEGDRLGITDLQATTTAVTQRVDVSQL